ncbi:MAG: general secretion pathway protein C [Polaromonas sp.]|nr:general secretion pathway protein C [Polaromonas sp.]
MQSKWTLRLITALLWALAAASAVYWGLRTAGPAAAVSVPEATALASAGDASARQAAIARFLGATNSVAAISSKVPIASRFSLIGVVTQGRGGAALLVVDGKPAKPYRVGSWIDEGMVLQSVGPRHVVLAASEDGPALQRLEMPSPKPVAGLTKRGPAAPRRSGDTQTE